MSVYTPATISGYNASPPDDSGNATSGNQITWQKHKEKIGDPLKILAEQINANVDDAFGSIFHNVTTSITTNYNVSDTDRGKSFKTAGAFTVTLPDPATVGNNFFITFINTDGAILTFDAGANLVNGQATIDLAAQYGGVFIFCDGVEFYALNLGGILDGSVNNESLVDMAANTIKGAVVPGTQQDLTVTQVLAMLDVDTKAEVDTKIANSTIGVPGEILACGKIDQTGALVLTNGVNIGSATSTGPGIGDVVFDTALDTADYHVDFDVKIPGTTARFGNTTAESTSGFSWRITSTSNAGQDEVFTFKVVRLG